MSQARHIVYPDAEEFMAQHYEDYLNRIIPEFLQRWQ